MIRLGTSGVIHADARHLPLADATVDLIVTSPPYFALRSYTDGGEHYDGQIGSEATAAEYLDDLLQVTRECVRVLKPTGSMWVNLGDKYAAAERGPDGSSSGLSNGAQFRVGRGRRVSQCGVPRKSLIGLPWRYALRCVDDLGLILRAEVVWSKPNGLPESVTDRVRRSHEQWFHFALQPRYYSAIDEIREPTEDIGHKAKAVKAGPLLGNHGSMGHDGAGIRMDEVYNNPLGKLPGSVWTIPSQPLAVPPELGVDHFAAFPVEWPKRIILGWSPVGICAMCGEGLRPVSASEIYHINSTSNAKTLAGNSSHKGIRTQRAGFVGRKSVTITGYACGCPTPDAPTRPAVVLDPFGGTGTVALAAKSLGRHGISIDMSADYCRLTQWRTNDRRQLAAVLDITTADQIPADQGALF